MPSIDESIRKIDNVICRHLDEIENNSRGAISQDILEQLTKFVNHIMLKFYANGREIPITAENIAKATEFAQINSELYTLYKFHNYLEVVTTQYTLDEDGSERLMLKYYQYLLEAKNLIWHYFGIEVLHNLEKFPLHLDDTLQEYYKKISEKIERYPVEFKADKNDKYYVQKIKPLFVNRHIYYEITFTPIDDRKNKSKSNRVIAFTKLPIKSNYASKFHLIHETIEILGKTMPIIIIDGWEVSIRDCEFQNFIKLIKGEKKRVPYPEQRLICEFLTRTIIKGIEILNPDTHEERIQFDVEIPKVVDESDLWRINLELLECWESEEKSLVRFCVHKLKSADEDGDESISLTVVPFQIAYAVSIHKAQGLEYDSVKIVITDEVEELVTHNIFYTAITRARERLKIYWTPEVEEKVINRIRPRDISKDVELLKNYLTEKQQEESFDFWL